MEAERGVQKKNLDLNLFLYQKSSVSISIHVQLLGCVGWFLNLMGFSRCDNWKWFMFFLRHPTCHHMRVDAAACSHGIPWNPHGMPSDFAARWRCGKVHAASLAKCSEEFLKRHVPGIFGWNVESGGNVIVGVGFLMKRCKIIWWTFDEPLEKSMCFLFFQEDVHGCSVDFFRVPKSCT